MFTVIDANTMWNKFKSIIDEVIDKMLPTKVIKEWSYPKWMTIRAKLATFFLFSNFYCNFLGNGDVKNYNCLRL